MTSTGSSPIDPAGVRRALRSAGLRARHGLSQNFLVDPDALEAILAAAAPASGRRVLEIGPGLGILTGALLEAGAAVTAVELDAGLAGRLRDELAGAIERGARDPDAGGGLRLIEADVLDLDLRTLVRAPYDVVANLPYHITSPVLHRLLDGAVPPPDRAVLMLQREVAERIAAPAGAMSYLSVFVQYHAAVQVTRIVPRTSFEPAPAVDSAIVLLDVRRDPAPLGPADEDALWRLVQAGFRERRKMLHNVLARQLPVDAERVAGALVATGIDPDRRPQTLSVAEWLALRSALGPIGADARGRRGPARDRSAGRAASVNGTPRGGR